MAGDKLTALEARVREMVELIQTLKRENAGLKSDLRAARERLVKQHASGDQWVSERADIKVRIEKVLSELDALEFIEESKEVALD
ncbi:MAG TPA: cell division protein ZapB [Nitrospiraceae bacterium]|nr:cell division protein ZapB [Nitrospiraceae bacterium]